MSLYRGAGVGAIYRGAGVGARCTLFADGDDRRSFVGPSMETLSSLDLDVLGGVERES
jgi:hypothetical protein